MSKELRQFSFVSPSDAGTTSQSEEFSRLQDLPIIVRRLYIDCRRQFTGQYDYGSDAAVLPWDGEAPDAWGRKRKTVWPRLATHIVALGASPIAYITAQFWYARQNNQAVLPTQMFNEEAIAKYRRYAKDLPKELALKLTRELASIRVMTKGIIAGLGWETLDALRQALFDIGQVSASPLCRFCVAVEYNLPNVAEHYKARALVQYVFQRQYYDEAWGGCIPDTFKAEGLSLAHRVLG